MKNMRFHHVLSYENALGPVHATPEEFYGLNDNFIHRPLEVAGGERGGATLLQKNFCKRNLSK